ncbi:type II secretion system protein GspD [Candidatus Omnitrophota bacterium]
MKGLGKIILLILLLSCCKLTLAQNTQVKRYPIQSADPQTLESVIGHVLGPQGKVTYDSGAHSLIIIDTPGNLHKITKIIEEVDISLKMVNIEVVTAEVSAEFLEKAGLNAARLTLPRARFSAILTLLLESNDTTVSTRSMIKTLSNQPARIQVTKDAVVAVARYIYFPSGTTVDIPITEAIGDILEVLPFVNADNTITLNIRPSMSTLDNSYSPYQRSISTQVTIGNGETLALGGLTTQKEQKQHTQTLLGLPLSTSKTKQSKNMVMFVTAEIIE